MKSEQTIRGFDRLAWLYDGLAGLVYGRALRKAQTEFLSTIETSDRVLVLGGGTGWFLEALLHQCEVNSVVYIEASGGMMQRSRKRLEKNMPEMVEKVEWIQEKWTPDLVEGRFDLVCTHCFLDLFGPAKFSQVVSEIKGCLKDRGNWYFSDFRHARSWPMSWISSALIWTMYRFFRAFAGIDAIKLPDFEGEFEEQGLKTVAEKKWFGGMVEARMLQTKKEALRRELPGL